MALFLSQLLVIIGPFGPDFISGAICFIQNMIQFCLFVFYFFNFISLSENVQSYLGDFLTWQFYISDQFFSKFLILDLSPFTKREDKIPFTFAIGSTPEYFLEVYKNLFL